MNKSMPKSESNGAQLIPIYIGVTGHRDILDDDVPELKDKVASIIAALRKDYPNTPLKVLSSLAEGADRLVAEVGLQNGCPLITVLPMPTEDYEKDFATDEPKKAFRELLAQSEAFVKMPFAEGSTPDNIKNHGEPRDKQYAAAGNYVAAHSQVLIALWNGEALKGSAGTSAIVKIKLSGYFDQSLDQSIKKRHPFDVPDGGPVYHIFTRRKLKDSHITAPPVPVEGDNLLEIKQDSDGKELFRILYPSLRKKDDKSDTGSSGFGVKPTSPTEDARKYYTDVLSNISAFNSEANTRCKPDKVKESIQRLLPAETYDELPDALKKIINLHGSADVLADTFRDTTVHALIVLLAGAVLSFSFLGIYSELLPTIYILALFPVILGLVYLYYRSMSTHKIKDKFADYRALAEALRVQFFWKLIGSREDVRDHYLRKYKGEMSWILHAVHNISFIADLSIPGPDKKEALKATMDKWVKGQREFFSGRVDKKKERVNAQELFTKVFFFAAMLLVMGLFVFKGISIFVMGNVENILSMEDVKEWTVAAVMLVAVDILIAIGAALATYVEKRGFSDEMKEYQRMDSLYRRAEIVINQYIENNELEMAERLLIDLGREALTENGDWLLLQRSRPLEMPLEG